MSNCLAGLCVGTQLNVSIQFGQCLYYTYLASSEDDLLFCRLRRWTCSRLEIASRGRPELCCQNGCPGGWAVAATGQVDSDKIMLV